MGEHLLKVCRATVCSVTLTRAEEVTMLTVALPNGTLENRTTAFFEKAGIWLRRAHRNYRAKVEDSRIARVQFMRPQIIPRLVQRGHYDLGVVGSDVVAETACEVTVLAKLDFSARGVNREFRIVLVGGCDDPAQKLKDIQPGCTILSEFPRITRLALAQAGLVAQVEYSFGATEAHVPHDFRYGVCIASTGETLAANDLKIIDVLSTETTVIIGGPSRLDGGGKEAAARSLLNDLLQ